MSAKSFHNTKIAGSAPVPEAFATIDSVVSSPSPAEACTDADAPIANGTGMPTSQPIDLNVNLNAPTQGEPLAHDGASDTLVCELNSLVPSIPAATSRKAQNLAAFDGGIKHNADGFKMARSKQGQIHHKTGTVMRSQTNKMIVTASRGYDRNGHVPTKFTSPPLHKARYSVDVNTKNWLKNKREVPKSRRLAAGWKSKDLDERLQVKRLASKSQEAEPPVLARPVIPLPNPQRYPGFVERDAHNPPWNTDIYLELGTATIHNDAFHYIMTHKQDATYECWMRGESLDMALEVLRVNLGCEDAGIGFASSDIAQIIFAAFSTGDCHSLSFCKDMYADKKWIFIVLNDNIGGNEHGGRHWSLLVFDCVHKRAHLYDSLFIYVYSHQILGENVARGLMEIMGWDQLEWEWCVEWNSPNQNRHNAFDEDEGACGPFVYKMIELLVQGIKNYQANGQEDNCSLTLLDGFGNYFQQIFHSLDVRTQMASSIADMKMKLESERLTFFHDQAAVENAPVVLLDGPNSSTFGFPPRSEGSQSTENLDTKTEGATQSGPLEVILISSDEEEDTPNTIERATDNFANMSDVETEAAKDIMLDDIEDILFEDADGDYWNGGIQLINDDGVRLWNQDALAGIKHIPSGGRPDASDDKDAGPVAPRRNLRRHDSSLFMGFNGNASE